MKNYMVSVLLSLIFGTAPVRAELYRINGYLKDANESVITFEAETTPRFVFTPDTTPEAVRRFVIEAAKIELANISTKTVRKGGKWDVMSKSMFKTANEQLEFIGYKATKVTIISIEVGQLK